MAQPIISVIVPVYGVERWLPACADSLLNQDFSDFELILVDDGSPDNCPVLCDSYAARDSRVKVIHRENGGLSAARNSGIEVASGQYIAFVDSDDLVAPDYLSTLYEAALHTQADLVVCGVEDVTEEGESLPEPCYSLPREEGVFEGRALLSCFFDPKAAYYTVAWNKLYKAELWKELRYPEGMIHEDDAVAHRLYAACTSVCCLAKPLYFYRMRQGSICRAGVRPGTFDGVSAHIDWCRFFASEPDLEPLLSPALQGCWLRYLSLCAEAKKAPVSWSLAARWQAVQCELRALLPLLSRCRDLTLRQKLSCQLWARRPLPIPDKTDKKRIVLLLPPDLPVPPVQGGAVETLAQHLIRQNEREQKLELCVVCRFDPEAAGLAARFKQTLFHYQPPTRQTLSHRVRFRLAGLFGRSIHWNAWYAQPISFLKRLDPDLCIAEGGDASGWQQASRVLGRDRFLVHLHGEAQGSDALDKIYSDSLAISDYIGHAWQDGTDRPFRLVPNCVDTAAFCPGSEEEQKQAADLRRELGYTEEDFVVLFCGRTCPEKGIHQLISAFEQLSDPRFKLLIVGSPFFGAESDSDYFAQLKQRASALSDRIQFTGFVHNSRLPNYYRLADAACFPALWDEPAGLTAIEAMACGCPIVATRSGGMQEYLEGSDAVLIQRSEIWKDGELLPVDSVPPMDRAIADALSLIQNDPDRRAAMSRAGVKAAQRFTPAAYYTAVLNALSNH